MSYADYKLIGYRVLNTYLRYSNLKMTADELAKKISSSPQIIGQLGNYFSLALNSDQDLLERAMENLANRAGSNIPDSTSFFNAMKSEVESDFIYVTKFAAQESAKEIYTGVENVAKTSLDIVKLAYFLIPVVIVGGLYLYGKKLYERV